MGQIFMEKHSKGEFHVLVKELKLFDHKFFFKYIATRHFDFLQRCFAVFVLFFNRLYSAVFLADNNIRKCFPLSSLIFF